MAAGTKNRLQDAGSTYFVIALRSFANQRWWYSPLKTVCLRGGARRNITRLAAEQRLDDSRVLVGQCDRSAIVSASGDHLLQPNAMWIGFTLHIPQDCTSAMDQQRAQVGVTPPTDPLQP